MLLHPGLVLGSAGVGSQAAPVGPLIPGWQPGSLGLVVFKPVVLIAPAITVAIATAALALWV
jgi:hypothetical protein